MRNVWYVEVFAPLMVCKLNPTTTVKCGNLPVTTLVPSQSLLSQKLNTLLISGCRPTTPILMEEPVTAPATHTSKTNEEMDTIRTSRDQTCINNKQVN